MDNTSAATVIARGLTRPNDTGHFEVMLDDDLDSYESHCLLKVFSHSWYILSFL